MNSVTEVRAAASSNAARITANTSLWNRTRTMFHVCSRSQAGILRLIFASIR
jgi:hypothetical protein